MLRLAVQDSPYPLSPERTFIMQQQSRIHKSVRAEIRKRFLCFVLALAALAASKPGTPGKSIRDVELEEANAEIARLSEAVKELAVKLTLLEGKGGRV